MRSQSILAQLVVDEATARDPRLVEVRLEFAGKTIELPARVLQVTSSDSASRER